MGASFHLPAELMESLQLAEGFDELAFQEVHESPAQVTSVRLNPQKAVPTMLEHLDIAGHVPWTNAGYYLTQRPVFTLDPLLHAGAYYVQEASSMFLEQALQQTVDRSQPLKVLDLCAAPGGKSTHFQSLISEEAVLVSNEVIRNRVTILAENITKWGAANVIVTNNDPQDFSELTSYFDVIVVDAPCSGSGLFRKDHEAVAQWSLNGVEHCSLRQQRILADVWPALKEGGVLIYSTCSYSLEEDEAIIDWLAGETGAKSVQLELQKDWGIVESETPLGGFGYRFYPYNLNGEGFFIACLVKNSEAAGSVEESFPYKPDKKLQALATNWISTAKDLYLYQHKDKLYAMPPATLQAFLQLKNILNVRKAGVLVGDIARSEIVPDHALAVATVCNKNVTSFEVDEATALNYLRKEPLVVDGLPIGWVRLTYKSLALGWIKNMGNRINNYYPKEWRIRM